MTDEFPPKEEELIKNEFKDVSGNMTRVLLSSDNPKHRNCKFLKFLKKLESGAYKFENDALVKVPEKLAEFKQEWQQHLRAEESKHEESKLEETKVDKQQLFSTLFNSQAEVTDQQCKFA